MKFGINLLLWTGNFVNDDIKWFPVMKEMGFDGVELPVFAPDDVDTVLVKKALEDNGLGCTFCTVMPQDGSLVDEDPENRQRGVDYLKKVIDCAVAVNCEVICGPQHSPVGKLVGRGRNEAEWNHAVNNLKIVAEHAEANKMKISLEPLNRFETYFLNTAEDTCKLCAEVGSDFVGYHYDTFHANIEEKDPVAAIKASGKTINHFHCSENDRGICGSGHVPWKASFDALKEIGYDDWLTIESMLPGIKELAAAAAIWRELAPSGEVLAKESLDFIKANV